MYRVGDTVRIRAVFTNLGNAPSVTLTGLAATVYADDGSTVSGGSVTVTNLGNGVVQAALTGALGKYTAVFTVTNTSGLDSTTTYGEEHVAAAVDPSDVTKWNGTAVASPHTAGYPIVTVKDGTGTGEIDTASGKVLLADGAITAAVIATDAIDNDAIAASAVTEIQSGLATAAALVIVGQYVDTEVGAIKSVTDDLATMIEDNGSGQKRFDTIALSQAPSGGGGGSFDPTTDAVIVGSIQANVITAASVAANAIDASALATDAVTEIQSGLATSAQATEILASLQNALITIDSGSLTGTIKIYTPGTAQSVGNLLRTIPISRAATTDPFTLARVS